MCPPQSDAFRSFHPAEIIEFLMSLTSGHDHDMQCMNCCRRRLEAFVAKFPETKDLAVEMYSERFPYAKSLEFFL